MTDEQRDRDQTAKRAPPQSGIKEHGVPATLWLVGDGEMISRVREFDWSKTPVGPIENWSASLRNTVATVLHSRHPMFLWWGEELIQFYNDAYVPSFGVGKHPAALGQRGRECWPEIWPIIGPQIDAVMNQGIASWHEDARVPIFRNGAIEEVFWTYGYSPAFDDFGRIGGTLVICTETTGRVFAARTLKRERERLEEFFQQVPAGVCTFHGEDLTFEFANNEYQRFIGKGELVGKPLLTAIPELRGQGFDELLLKVMRTGETVFGHEVLAKHDREGSGSAADKYYTFSYSPFRDAQGAVAGVIALVLDVTEQVLVRRQADQLAEQLKQSEDQFRTLAESIPQLAWIARPDGHIEWYNRRWYDYTGTNFEAMEGWGWRLVHDPALLDEVILRLSRALASGEPFEMQFPLRRHDGAFRWHLTLAVPVRDASGAIVRWFGTNTDIHDSRRAEQDRIALLERERAARLLAESASRAKDEFLATASHELRTPLNAILGWTRILRAGHVAAGDHEKALEKIERNALAQVRLIEDILDGSRVITGRLTLEIHTLDMTLVTAAALDAVRPAAEAKQIRLKVFIDPAAGPMSGDADRLQQVVWNLANNAIKFTPKGGEVEVRLQRVDGDVVLTVADNGQGIEPEFLPYVFERFRQAENSTSRRHGGLGLGLALVRHLIEAHGGAVQVTSAGPGLGAQFVATIPATAVPLPKPASERPSAVPELAEVNHAAVSLAGLAVLVVDDEEDARAVVSTFLRAKGAQVTSAPSATAALQLLRIHPYAALVSDVGMPEVDGYELIRRVRALPGAAAKTPAVALTAYAREEDRRLALAAGFQAYVAKPVDPELLARLVRDAIARSLS